MQIQEFAEDFRWLYVTVAYCGSLIQPFAISEASSHKPIAQLGQIVLLRLQKTQLNLRKHSHRKNAVWSFDVFQRWSGVSIKALFRFALESIATPWAMHHIAMHLD